MKSKMVGPWHVNPCDWNWDGGAPALTASLPGGYALALIWLNRGSSPSDAEPSARPAVCASLLDQAGEELAAGDAAMAPVGEGSSGLRLAFFAAARRAVGLLYPGSAPTLDRAIEELEAMVGEHDVLIRAQRQVKAAQESATACGAPIPREIVLMKALLVFVLNENIAAIDPQAVKQARAALAEAVR